MAIPHIHCHVRVSILPRYFPANRFQDVTVSTSLRDEPLSGKRVEPLTSFPCLNRPPAAGRAQPRNPSSYVKASRSINQRRLLYEASSGASSSRSMGRLKVSELMALPSPSTGGQRASIRHSVSGIIKSTNLLRAQKLLFICFSSGVSLPLGPVS